MFLWFWKKIKGNGVWATTARLIHQITTSPCFAKSHGRTGSGKTLGYIRVISKTPRVNPSCAQTTEKKKIPTEIFLEYLLSQAEYLQSRSAVLHHWGPEHRTCGGAASRLGFPVPCLVAGSGSASAASQSPFCLSDTAGLKSWLHLY